MRTEKMAKEFAELELRLDELVAEMYECGFTDEYSQIAGDGFLLKFIDNFDDDETNQEE